MASRVQEVAPGVHDGGLGVWGQFSLQLDCLPDWVMQWRLQRLHISNEWDSTPLLALLAFFRQ